MGATRLPSLLNATFAKVTLSKASLRRWLPTLGLVVLAVAVSPCSFDLFDETRLYPSASLVVVSLLLLGNRGLLVGLVVSLVAVLQWSQPLMLVLGLAELIWLKLYLDHVGQASQRRDNGWIVLADILFWVLVGIPLAFLLFGVVMNLDPSSVLNLAIRQGINGSINAIIGYLIYVLFRLIGAVSQRQPALSIRGITLIALLAAIVLPCTALLSQQSWQLQQAIGQEQLNRLRQVALIGGALDVDDIGGLMQRQRQHGSMQELRLLEGGRILFDSNPALFGTLETHYLSQLTTKRASAPFPQGLELVVPKVLLEQPRAALRGYWRYDSSIDLRADPSLLPSLRQGQQVLVVEPARSRIQELQEQGSKAQGILSWIVLLAALLAEACARAIESQFPELQPQAVPRREQRSNLREVDRLLQALKREQEKGLELWQRLRHSEMERDNLREEVHTLSIRDPLTGCYNRAELYRWLDLEIQRSKRESRQLSLQLLEIDHLRQLADSCGSPVAEEMLRRVAAEIVQRTRSTDLVCRLAEDQFAVLLPSCEAEAARRVAELLCRTIAALEVQSDGIHVAATLSIGVAALRLDQDDIESLINRAENALYRAKAEGRNRAVLI
jgi:diguanylate cyclase (GGDEF)-like protein